MSIYIAPSPMTFHFMNLWRPGGILEMMKMMATDSMLQLVIEPMMLQLIKSLGKNSFCFFRIQ